MVSFRGQINVYTNRVLGVIKEKYGLKDRSAALDWFVKEYGNAYIPREESP